MIFTVIPFDKYNLFCDCDFDNSLENKKYINRKKKFAYGELFMLVMIGYIFMFKMVKKLQNSGLETVAGLTRRTQY